MFKGGIFIFGIFERLKDLLFPVFCVGCKKEGVWMCSPCQQRMKPYQSPKCIICGRDRLHAHFPSAESHACRGCCQKLKLHGLIAICEYDQPMLRKSLHLWKYEYIEALGKILADVFVRFIGERFSEAAFSVVPVPLHRRRYLERGFNQAEMLAFALASARGWEYLPSALKRKRYTSSQISGNREKRWMNVHNCFSLQSDIRGQNILLVDDVLTTGATLFEAASVLRHGGAQHVYAAVLAKRVSS